jgi:Tfp pilus assembly protein PilV
VHASPPSRTRFGLGTPRPRSRWQRGSSGFSLVEVLISVLLVSSVVLALVTGLLTLVRTTESNHQRQQIQLALGNLSEGVRAMDYIECGTATAYRADYGAPASANWTPTRAGMTFEILDVEYWNASGRTFQASCPAGDGGAQQLTLKVEWRDREDTTQVVLRR